MAEAQAHDGRDVAVDGMLGGQDETALESRIASDDQVDGGVGSDGAGPLDVEIGFNGGAVGAIGIVDAVDAGIVAVDDDLGGIGGQAEEGAELIDQIDVDVGLVDDGDGLAGAVDAGGVERIEVVLDGVVAGREDEVDSAVAAADGPLRRGLCGVGIVLALPSFLA